MATTDTGGEFENERESWLPARRRCAQESRFPLSSHATHRLSASSWKIRHQYHDFLDAGGEFRRLARARPVSCHRVLHTA